MSASVDIQAYLDGLKRESDRMLAVALRALEEYSAHVVGDAQELCPVDTGFLKDAGTWRAPERGPEGYFCEVGFNTRYAAAVHERLDVKHPQGQAKFLHEAITRNAPKLGPYIAGRVREAGGA